MYQIFKSFWILAVVVMFSTPAGAQQQQLSDKVDPTVWTHFDSKEKVEYIVLMKDRQVFNGPLTLKTKNEKARHVYHTLKKKADESQKAIIMMLRSKNITYQSFYITNAIQVTSDFSTMVNIASDPDVQRIIDNAPFKMVDYRVERSEQKQRNAEPEWGIKNIKADSVWQLGIKGNGVIIAGQDTGYDWDVSPLKAKYKGYVDSATVTHDFNWHDAIKKNNPVFADTVLNPCGYSLKSPCDDNNHGTHTMGSMVGGDEDNIIGVAPEAKWVACRNMDRGWGQPSTYLECFEWFLAPYDLDGQFADPDKAPHVINNSWYCSEQEGCNPSNFILMDDVIKNLKASGIVVVVSAGNSGNGCGSVTGPPAFFESSFSVGASDDVDNIAGFSSRGPVVIDSSFRLKPNVAAPGVNVRSVIANGEYANFSGTSMAGPHVAGLVALMISANLDLAGNVEAIEDIIEATARPKNSDQDCGSFLGAVVPNAVFGYGIVDGLEAVKRALDYTTDVKNVSPSDVRVFPNPADDLLTFVLDGGGQFISDIHLYDMNGKVVLSENMEDNHLVSTLVVSSLQKGIYIYKILADGHTTYGRFVKL